MYTANTMASAIEAMGFCLPNNSSTPAVSNGKFDDVHRIGNSMKYLIKNNIKPSDIISRTSLENAMTLITVLGGSTNAVLHLLAIAHTAGIYFSLDDFQMISNKTPYLADLKPSGKHLMEDLHHVGGTAAVLKYLLDLKMIDGSSLTVTGKSLAENLKDYPGLTKEQNILHSIDSPIKESGHIRILRKFS